MQTLCDDILLYFTTFLSMGDLYRLRCTCSRFSKFQEILFAKEFPEFEEEIPVIAAINHRKFHIDDMHIPIDDHNNLMILWDSPDEIKKYCFVIKCIDNTQLPFIHQTLFNIACSVDDFSSVKYYGKKYNVDLRLKFRDAFSRDKLGLVKCIFKLSLPKGGWSYLLQNCLNNNILSYLTRRANRVLPSQTECGANRVLPSQTECGAKCLNTIKWYKEHN